MKRLGVRLALCMILLLVVSSQGYAVAAGNLAAVSMSIDGLIVGFGEQAPYIDSVSGRTMIPLRTVAESLGAEVSWDNKDTATIKKNGIIINMKVGSKSPTVNGNVKSLDAPALLVNGKVMVPVRFLSEAMGCQVQWNQTNNCVVVVTDGSVAPIVEPVQSNIEVKHDAQALLPQEDKIQKELTAADIARLKTYPASQKPQQELAKLSPEERAKFGKHSDTFNKSLQAKALQGLDVLKDLCNVDYTKFSSNGYREEYKSKYFSIGWKQPGNDAIISKYIDDSIKSGLKTRGYYLTDENLVWQASPQYTAVRVKYIFYQESGTKIEEEGSTLGKWSWKDMEILFATPFGVREGNTVGLIYTGYGNLNAPQPYVFN